MIAQEGKHVIGEEIIRGEKKKVIDEKKIEVMPPIDPGDPIDTILTGERYIFDNELYNTIDNLNAPILYLHSEYLKVPIVSRLFKGTIYLFFPSFEQAVSSWRLEISDSQGNTVRIFSGRGTPPTMLEWNGRSDEGEMVVTGEFYNLVLTAYDAIGNPTRIPSGRALWIRGISYQEGGTRIVSLAGSELFRKNSAILRHDAEDLLDEIANEVKSYFKKEVVIYAYTQSEPLSSQWCRRMKEEMVERLVLPPGALKTTPRFIPGLEPKFSKVELVIN
ncbi:MAG TPA: hypothetical protein EYP24_03435 [bacterium (Candidatus Stahlbacteria)]|nr:hypothetical protein [Candidatus Stahlbacteria bacterium]